MQVLIKLIAILSLFLLFMSCGSKENKASGETTPKTEKKDSAVSNQIQLSNAQYNTAGVQLGSVELKQISGTFKASGKLDIPPQQQVSISVPMGGFLRKTDMLQGKFVNKGELIAVVENPDFITMQQDYLDAKSQLEYATADYERQQVLAKENVNAGKTLQQAKAAYYSLVAKTEGLGERIKVSGLSLAAVEKGNIQPAINIYAPISGYVTEVNANLGKYLTPKDILFEIVDTRHLHAELTIFEKDVPKLKIGQTVRFTLANETRERIAKVYLIGREIGSDRTVTVHCHIEGEDNQMIPGTYLKAIVETGANEVPALPSEAIVDYVGEKYIFILSGNGIKESKDTASKEEYQFTMVPVQTGNTELTYTEVTLPETVDRSKAQVVIKGAYSLLSKMKNSEEEE